MRSFRPVSLALLLLPACGGEDAPTPTPPVYLDSPLCSAIAPAHDPRELFTSPLLSVEAISEAYPFGDTQPNDVQEIINFELGFYIRNEPAFASVPLTAPADLHVKTLEVSRYDDDHDGTVDREDYGISYEVCSIVVDGQQQPGVAGNFAHLRTLSPNLMAIVEQEKQRLIDGTVTEAESPLRCANGAVGVGTCTYFVSLVRETIPDYALVITEGTPFATTSFPGFDANLRDYRRNGGSGNHFIQPTRWGSDSGHAAGFRYGACTYEYFAEPYRTQYLSRIGANGVFRNLDDNAQPVEVEHPCGLLEADLGAEGTAAGFWMIASKADLFMYEDMSLAEVEDVLAGMLVLNENFLRPNTHLSMSTHTLALSGAGMPPYQMLVEFPIDTPADSLTNVPFHEVVPGQVYCYEGSGYMNEYQKFSFLLELVNEPTPTLRVERIEDAAPCSEWPQEKRLFTEAAIPFVR